MTDFRYGGEVVARPAAGSSPSPRELNHYNYFRRNAAGVQREWWYHRSGCRAWFQAERDTIASALFASGQRVFSRSFKYRGEMLIGAEIEPWTTYRQTGTLNFLQESCRHALELFPQLETARMLRSWAGLCDISPDYSPILGRTEVDGFHLSAGWRTYGFKAAPIVGTTLAELVDTGRTPELIEPFKLERFYEDRLVSELGAAAVSH